MKTGVIVGLLVAVLAGEGSAAQANQGWFLMSRHGECADVASLTRKVPDLGEARDPESFSQLMRVKGYQITVNETATPNGKVVEILVPERELALVFVTAALCQSTGDR
jgi:hypothetical protein